MNTIILFTFLTLNLVEQRKFVLKKLNEFGIVKASLTEIITQQVKLLIKAIKEDSSDYLTQLFCLSTIKSIWKSVTRNYWLDLDNHLVRQLYQCIDKMINSSRLASVFMVI